MNHLSSKCYHNTFATFWVTLGTDNQPTGEEMITSSNKADEGNKASKEVAENIGVSGECTWRLQLAPFAKLIWEQIKRQNWACNMSSQKITIYCVVLCVFISSLRKRSIAIAVSHQTWNECWTGHTQVTNTVASYYLECLAIQGTLVEPFSTSVCSNFDCTHNDAN